MKVEGLEVLVRFFSLIRSSLISILLINWHTLTENAFLYVFISIGLLWSSPTAASVNITLR